MRWRCGMARASRSAPRSMPSAIAARMCRRAPRPMWKCMSNARPNWSRKGCRPVPSRATGAPPRSAPASPGVQAHTGPTPMERRRDALLGASYLIAALRELCGRAADTLYTSVGRIEAYPNSPNSIVSEATLWVELRSPVQQVLAWAEEEFLRALEAGGRARRCHGPRASYRAPRGRRVRCRPVPHGRGSNGGGGHQGQAPLDHRRA